MMKSTRCVRCKLCNFSTTSAQQYGRTLGSEVTNFPGSGAYIPLGSLPSRQFRYLIRRIASLARPGNPASRRRYIQPRAPAQALPPGPILGRARRYHVLFLPALPYSAQEAELHAAMSLRDEVARQTRETVAGVTGP